MRDYYELTVPFDSGMLNVGDGQAVYWEVTGNPKGKPAVALHGGPGSGLAPGRRRAFNLETYLLVQFDQRGCGRSTPPVSDLATDLTTNTTHHLIADMERLREHLDIGRWLVWGGSWGATLAIAYAQVHPDRVTEMVLVSGMLGRPSDIHWLYHDAGRFLPAQWSRFRDGGGAALDLVASYNTLLNEHPDPAIRRQAAQDWCDWEDAVVSLDEGWKPSFENGDYRMTFARLCAHYFSHAAWLDDDQLLRNATQLADIPCVMVHGQFDIGLPVDSMWSLAQAWPGSVLHLTRSGHTGGHASKEAMLAALDRFGNQP